MSGEVNYATIEGLRLNLWQAIADRALALRNNDRRGATAALKKMMKIEQELLRIKQCFSIPA